MDKEYIRLHLSQNINIKANKNIRIIKYNSKEHHSLIPILYSKGFNDTPWSKHWDNIKDFDPSGVFLGMDKTTKNYIGFAISFNKNDFGYISVVTVLPEYRNNGYAKTLIKSCIEYLKSTGKKKIIIDVKSDNINAFNLYKKIGFIEN